jgi:hypothetical protein
VSVEEWSRDRSRSEDIEEVKEIARRARQGEAELAEAGEGKRVDDLEGRLREGTPTTFYDGKTRIPGYGSPPERCRDYTPVGYCTEQGHTFLGRSSCGTRDCPDHWRDWIEESVVSMVAQLAAWREAQPMGPERQAGHVVASPPQDRRYSRRAMWETRSEAYEAFEAAGVPGGAVVTHPYRLSDQGEMLYAAAKDAGHVEEGVGKWAFLRDVTAPEWGELTPYVEAAPHYHAIAPLDEVDGSDAPEGWVVELVRTFDVFHYRDEQAYEDMVSAAYYVLTHGGVQKGRATRTMFGELHSFDPEEELTAARWDTIQRMAEKVVGAAQSDEEGEGPTGPECPREECDGVVRELCELPEQMRDREWRESLSWENRARLRGVLVWWEGRSDRPPPSVATDKEKLRQWFRELGDVYVERPEEPSEGPGDVGMQAELPSGVF